MSWRLQEFRDDAKWEIGELQKGFDRLRRGVEQLRWKLPRPSGPIAPAPIPA
jgi:hypothetical protein